MSLSSAAPGAGASSLLSGNRADTRGILVREIEFLARQGVPERRSRCSRRDWQPAAAPRRLQELFALGFDRRRYWSLLAADLGLGSSQRSEPREASRRMRAFRQPTRVRSRSIGAGRGRRAGRSGRCAAARDEIPLLRRRLQEKPALARAHPHRRARDDPRLHRRRSGAMRSTHYAVEPARRARCRACRRAASAAPGRTRSDRAACGRARPRSAGAAHDASRRSGLLSTLFFCNCSFWKLAAAFRPPAPLRARAASTSAAADLHRARAALSRGRGRARSRRASRAARLPGSKLQILLILEADDDETRAAVARHVAAPHFEVIVVPPGGPRTKPKALTYALPFARGDYVVVFDAEDRPEPDQLRKAAAAFRERPRARLRAGAARARQRGQLARAHVRGRICRELRGAPAGARRMARAAAARRNVEPFSARRAGEGRRRGIRST